MEILAATKVPNEIAAGKRCCKRSGSACPGAFQDAVLFPGIHQAYIPMSGRFRCAQSSHDAGVQAVNILARIGNDYLHFSGTLLYCIQMDVDQCVEVGGLVQFRIKERC